MNILYLLLAGLFGYVLGSIPFGWLYVKAKTGKDIRTIGSGRMGGTNSYRAAGLIIGLLTALSDFLKGALSVWVAQWLFGGQADPAWLPWIATFGGVMAVIGHNWSVFLKFKGGAGTGPNVGWSTAVWLPMFPIVFLVGALLMLTVGMASVASMVVALIIPVVFAIRYFMGIDPTPAYIIGGLVTAAAVAWALRPNFKRILAGNERIVGPRAKRLEQQKQQAH
ncbi:MAG: glycerol-3-phosphate acyltransferase [Ardenticatenaceae bacterium]|nr:glycerol-3-phosphate acyltransferase [Ardenticatenaceae bacterium]